MLDTYSSYQVEDSLKRQGIDPELAGRIAYAIGDQRLNDQDLRRVNDATGIPGATKPRGDDGSIDSNLLPNLIQSAPMAVGSHYAAKYPGAMGKAAWMAGFLGGNLAPVPGNYYDRATMPQLIADMGGSFIGDAIGTKYGSALAGKLGTAGAALEKAAYKGGIQTAGKTVLGRLGAAGLGRAIGAVGGSFLSPLGSIALGTLGGWLLPKLIPGGAKSVEEEEKEGVSTRSGLPELAGMAGAYGAYRYRKPIKKWYDEKIYGQPFSEKTGETP